MLLKFTVENFLSFKYTQTLDLIASSMTQHSETNIIFKENYKLLKTIAIFGANASGKSNLFTAIEFARDFIINSSKDTQAEEDIPVEPFLLSTETENEPSLFEFIFINNDKKYRYGFRLNKQEIIDEWLFEAEKVRERQLFIRHKQKIELGNSFKEGQKLVDMTRNNALFLSVVAQFNGPISMSVIAWFKKLNVISNLSFINYNNVTTKILKDSKLQYEFERIFKMADFSIDSFSFKDRELSSAPKFIQEEFERAKKAGVPLELPPRIKTLHKKFNKNKELVENIEFDLIDNESDGTKNLFSLLGPIFDTISKGKILVIDEFEAGLHPLITRFIIKLLHYKNKSAQFIFNTHNTDLLNNKIFRRDQIYFVDKNKYGESSLYSLNDYNVRYDRTFNKDYLEGRYDAIPFIDDFGFWDDDNFLK